jgi:hypothetical protein
MILKGINLFFGYKKGNPFMSYSFSRSVAQMRKHVPCGDFIRYPTEIITSKL